MAKRNNFPQSGGTPWLQELFRHVTILARGGRKFRLMKTKLALGLVVVFVAHFVLGHAGATETMSLDRARAGAEKGEPKALYSLGKRCEKGDGMPQDYARAAEYYRQSAEKGFAFAQTDLAALYMKGSGVTQDYNRAAYWYRKAAENGDAVAQYAMGILYTEGQGVLADMQEALRWYHRAAEQNQTDAILALGDSYLNGSGGIPIDFKLALKWYQIGAKRGRVTALTSVGFIYENGGHGVEPDSRRALKYYREAAEKGDARGQMNLGRVYRDGLGMKSNLVQAYKWFYAASRNGDHVGDHYLRELEYASKRNQIVLTSEQMADARSQAEKYIRTKTTSTTQAKN
jgi:TPR repeat protein